MNRFVYGIIAISRIYTFGPPPAVEMEISGSSRFNEGASISRFNSSQSEESESLLVEFIYLWVTNGMASTCPFRCKYHNPPAAGSVPPPFFQNKLATKNSSGFIVLLVIWCDTIREINV